MRGSYAETISKVCGGEEAIKIWSLEGWRGNITAHDLKLFLLHSSCTMELEIPRIQFQFKFNPWFTPDGEEWLGVVVEPEGAPETKRFQYNIKMEALENNGMRLEERGEFLEKTQLSKFFLKLRKTSKFTDVNGTVVKKETEAFSWRGNLTLKISVIPIFFVNAEMEPNSPALSYSLQKVRQGVMGEADIALEAQDGEVVFAHKQVLSKGSGRFRSIFEQGLKEKDNGGMDRLYLPHLPQTIRIILYWLYTGKMHPTARDRVETMVEVANLYELKGLSDVLEIALIQVCTKKNMYALRELAEKYGMVGAALELSEFIEVNKKQPSKLSKLTSRVFHKRKSGK